MCGRFGLPGDHQTMMSNFNTKVDLGKRVNWEILMPRYNVAPTDQIPVIFKKGTQRYVKPMRWGLIPFYATTIKGRTVLDKEGKSTPTLINARSETVDPNGKFGTPFKRGRCLIPAGGFYEWKKEPNGKTPYWIRLKNRSWLAFAGLYAWWKSLEGEWLPSCTIITTVPNQMMEPIHARMPVILTEESYDLWLDPEIYDFSNLKELLAPYPSDKMEAYPVDGLVNNVKNDGSDLINPCGTLP